MASSAAVPAGGAAARGSGRPAAASPPTYGMTMREASIPMLDGVHLAADLWMPTDEAFWKLIPL